MKLTSEQIQAIIEKVEQLSDVLSNVRSEIDELSGELYEFSELEEIELSEEAEEEGHDLDEFHTLLEEVKELSQKFPTWSCISTLEDRCSDTQEELASYRDYLEEAEQNI